jgi:glycosyltransferase involved in cell wall biosynthesis
MDNINPAFPHITIVTPSFNQGKFLADTIESVIGQEGDFSIDYIIVDGGSTDNSVELIRQYEEMLHNGEWPVKCRAINYRWLSEKDSGQTDALIKGLRMANGTILAWLNSDDTYLPGTLQSVAGFFRDYPDTGLLYGDARYCDAGGKIIGRYRTEEFAYDKLAWFNFICQPSAFFRRDVFAAVGGLDESLHFAMDYDLWVRIGKRFTCRYRPGFLSMYRLHEASKTIRDETLYHNSEEALRLAMKYFAWAPLTRVYNSCNFLCRARLPAFLTGKKMAVIVAAIFCAMFRSLLLNRGINRHDLRLLNKENFRKLCKSRLEIMTGDNNRDRM